MGSLDSGSEASTPPPDTAARVREAVIVLLVCVMGLGGLLWGLNRKPAPEDEPARGASATHPAAIVREDFVGDSTCAECHPSIAFYHDQNGHSRTFRRAADRSLADRLDGRVVADPERPGVSWEFLLEDERFSVERRHGNRVDRVPIEFALGSGYHATTFVSRIEEADEDAGSRGNLTLREHRLTYYHDDSLRLTPGQKAATSLPGTDALGRIVHGDEAFDCLSCHVTLTSGTDADRFDEETMIPNVTCERCHGPGRSHIEDARGGLDPDALVMPFGPTRNSTEDQMRLCGACHRHPADAPPNTIRPDNFELIRYQPVGLMQSACYTQSNGALSCTTCHDPHRRPSTDPAYYTAACLSCHTPTQPEQVPCPVSPSQDCTSCHMPRLDSGQGIFFSDHWIRVRDELAPKPEDHPNETE
ncbi:multiheme c-type cytochrome [Tautonia rosea]|uniref:multiheme c-type cytochrome n=1 Tax=Tautonia rosea TaxID=2728037 RepID=UPI00147651D8|nr:multiheme c-type cytochrome [Tautonia rosea]